MNNFVVGVTNPEIGRAYRCITEKRYVDMLEK